MADNLLFNIPQVATPAAPVVPGNGTPPQTAPPTGSTGIITAKQSAITFAGAPAAVTLVWKVIGTASPNLAKEKLFAIGLSILIGMLIYWQTQSPGETSKEKVTGFVFALINSFAIAAATLGIDSASALSK